MQLVGAKNVRFISRCGENNDGYVLQLRIVLDLFKNFLAALLGQIEIQKHEMGGPGADIFALATKIAQRCFPIPHHIELIGYPGTLEGFPGEADITRAVFDKEDLNRFG